MLFLKTKFPHILISPKYGLLCKQKHCIQSENGDGNKKKKRDRRKVAGVKLWRHKSLAACLFL